MLLLLWIQALNRMWLYKRILISLISLLLWLIIRMNLTLTLYIILLNLWSLLILKLFNSIYFFTSRTFNIHRSSYLISNCHITIIANEGIFWLFFWLNFWFTNFIVPFSIFYLFIFLNSPLTLVSWFKWISNNIPVILLLLLLFAKKWFFCKLFI